VWSSFFTEFLALTVQFLTMVAAGYYFAFGAGTSDSDGTNASQGGETFLQLLTMFVLVTNVAVVVVALSVWLKVRMAGSVRRHVLA